MLWIDDLNFSKSDESTVLSISTAFTHSLWASIFLEVTRNCCGPSCGPSDIAAVAGIGRCPGTGEFSRNYRTRPTANLISLYSRCLLRSQGRRDHFPRQLRPVGRELPHFPSFPPEAPHARHRPRLRTSLERISLLVLSPSIIIFFSLSWTLSSTVRLWDLVSSGALSCLFVVCASEPPFL
jgi:hypothetical protein